MKRVTVVALNKLAWRMSHGVGSRPGVGNLDAWEDIRKELRRMRDSGVLTMDRFQVLARRYGLWVRRP